MNPLVPRTAQPATAGVEIRAEAEDEARPLAADCPHPSAAIQDQHGQWLRPSDPPVRYRCRLCGLERDTRDEFLPFTQLDWLQLYVETAHQHGVRLVGIEHEEFVPIAEGASFASLVDDLQACDELTLWLMLPGGRRCPALVVWQGPNATYQQADEIIADYSGPTLLDEIWEETRLKAAPAMRLRNPHWNGL